MNNQIVGSIIVALALTLYGCGEGDSQKRAESFIEKAIASAKAYLQNRYVADPDKDAKIKAYNEKIDLALDSKARAKLSDVLKKACGIEDMDKWIEGINCNLDLFKSATKRKEAVSMQDIMKKCPKPSISPTCEKEVQKFMSKLFKDVI